MNTVQNSTLYTNIKHINIIRKLVPSELLRKKWQIKLRDAGTIGHFDPLVQYQFTKNRKIDKRKHKNISKLKILGIGLYKCIKATTSAIWQHVLHIPTKVLFLKANRSKNKIKKNLTKEPTFRENKEV